MLSIINYHNEPAVNRLSKFFRIGQCFFQGKSITANSIDLQNRTYLITGGSSGMGAEVAKTLAYWGAHVLIACRSKSEGEQVAKLIHSHDPNASVTVYSEADTSDLGSMQYLADRVLSQDDTDCLDGLILNAGIGLGPHVLSKQGYEIHCATNVLGHHLLLRKLLSNLAKSNLGRVVFLVSELYIFADDCTLDYPREYPAYARSKLGFLWNALSLHERKEALGAPNISSIAVHPGAVATNIWPGPDWLKRKILITPTRGAQAIIHSATDQSIQSGSYFHNTRGIIHFDEHDPAMNKNRQIEFWDECEQAIAPYMN
jgi:NAD(P)-dependent dehydrogenase (short-subunit alcohol dehydrogenase family)